MLARQLAAPARQATSRQFASAAVSLDTPFPGVPDSTTVSTTGNAKVETSTLANGVRVVSADMGGPTASLRLLVASGSRCETEATAGAAQFLSHAAFKGTSSRSATRFAMDIEDLGGKFNASAGRESVVYAADVLQDNVATAVGMLGETALDGKFTAWSMKELKSGSFAAEMGELLGQPSTLLTESLHEAAFRDNSPLGRPCYSDGDALTADGIASFVSSYHGADNIVLAGAGVDHASLVDAANAALGGATAGAGPAVGASSFHGGEIRTRAAVGATHVSLAFAGAAAGDAQAAATYAVLATLLDAAGPAQAFNAVYRDAGLFGMYGCSDAPELLVDGMVGALGALAKGVDAAQLKGAVAGLVANAAGADGSRAATATELANRAARGSPAASPADVTALARNVTAADVSAAAAKALESKPALASLGNLSNMPYLDDIKF